jgi:hypothetical protein
MAGRNADIDAVRRETKQAPLPDEAALSDLDNAEAALADRPDSAPTSATTSCGCRSSAAIRTFRLPSSSPLPYASSWD